MALPKITHTLYEHKLVGLNKVVKFRPFTNAEQKILLMAKEEEGSPRAAFNAMKQIIANCTMNQVNADKLSTFDVEDLFLRLRAKSVGEVISVKYRYDYHDEEGKKLSKFIDVSINLDDVKVVTKEEHTNKIELSDTLGIVMKYPTFDLLEGATSDEDIAVACIDYIYDKDEIHSASEQTKEDLFEFYDSIETPGILKIKTFFQTMPRVRHEVEIKLPNDQTETVVFEGIEDFFS